MEQNIILWIIGIAVALLLFNNFSTLEFSVPATKEEFEQGFLGEPTLFNSGPDDTEEALVLTCVDAGYNSLVSWKIIQEGNAYFLKYKCR